MRARVRKARVRIRRDRVRRTREFKSSEENYLHLAFRARST